MSEKVQQVVLEGGCTIYEVSEKHHQILQQWNDLDKPVNIDLSAVTEVDNSFIQLLISCKNTAIANHVSFTLSNIPDELEQLMRKGHTLETLISQPE